VPSLSGESEFTIEKVNPNLLVDENEETDFFFFNDTDNISSTGELPTANLEITSTQLTGLGMGGDQMIGDSLVPGGIQYLGLEELFINLGAGDNLITIEDTHNGITTIHSAGGDDNFVVKSVSGHTFLNAGSGADRVEVGNAELLNGINALLTVTGDVPQAIALTLAKGSASDAVSGAEAVNEIQQITIDATGGTFQAGFILDGVRSFTQDLAYDVSAQDFQDALQAVLVAAYGVDDTSAAVNVSRGGNVYRITFLGEMGGRDVPLLAVNDRGLTTETGAGQGDVLIVDNSADTTDTQAVLTPTSLTGLGMGDLGDAGTSFNEIQTLRLDATAGSFTLGITGSTITSGELPFDISAASLDAQLEEMLLAYLNEVLLTANPEAPQLSTDDTAGGLVEVDLNDDVYVFRFVGLLSNFDVAQLTVDPTGLQRSEEQPDGTIVVVPGDAQTATRLDGITAESRNEKQRLRIESTTSGGTFTLAFPDDENDVNITSPLDWNLSRADLQQALEALPGIAPGDVVITEVSDGVFDIEFTGELSATNVADLIVDSTGLTGGSASMELVQEGLDTGLNDQQVLTVNAKEGFFQLQVYVPGLRRTLTTDLLAYDASAEEVRRALQDELARQLNGLEVGADLSRTREAFKSDFSVVRIGNVYHVGFQGLTRQRDGGLGVSLLKVLGDVDFTTSGDASVVTRMDGINYYGFEQVDLRLGSGADILNVQGTSAGSFKGINQPLDEVHAATNISLGDEAESGTGDRVFLSSNADLDINTDRTTSGKIDEFEFLTGDLEAFAGNLNLDLGSGRHRLLISDEADTSSDTVNITDRPETPSGEGGFDDISTDVVQADIQIKGLAFGDITYRAAPDGNLFDGVITWTGSGDDLITIDGTHYRSGERTTNLLNTGFGDDHVTVNLDAPGTQGEDDGGDGFFVLNTTGGGASDGTSADKIREAAEALELTDNDTVRAAGSTLPLILFGGLGQDDFIGGQADDVLFGDFGRVNVVDNDGVLIASYGYGGRDDLISSRIFDPSWVMSRHFNLGDRDILEGQNGDDILVGGTAINLDEANERFDYLDGDAGDDLNFGDAVQLFRRDINVEALGDITSLRYQALTGQVIYGRTDLTQEQLGQAVPTASESGSPLLAGMAYGVRHQDGSTVASWHEYEVKDLYHSQSILDRDDSVSDLWFSFSADYIAGGANHDMIFGQLGNDVIQGDGSIESAVGSESIMVNRLRLIDQQNGLDPVGARRQPTGENLDLTETVSVDENELEITPSFEKAETDGDDYIEGNGGDDTVFGNLGQDDIVGDNSSLFSLDREDERQPAGADLLFGGAGLAIDRNDDGDASVDDEGNLTIAANGHSRDADVIAGDNANIVRLVGVNGSEGSDDSDIQFENGFLVFNYDNYATNDSPHQRIISRAVELLDYTPGGPDHDSAAADDFGAGDEIHGEAGDDVAYGMVGDDLLFGDGQDDNLVGGWGNDWFSGGRGQDAIVGDDGRIFTSRNGQLEKLNGVFTAATEALITANPFQEAIIHLSGALKKAVDLTPFSQVPNWTDSSDEWQEGAAAPHSNDDIIYGGLGSDFLHGGSGDDAISGAEALEQFFYSPFNPGDVLGYNPESGEFASYDENAPRTRIENFFLNFDEQEGVLRKNATYGDVRDDGDDRIFGGLGNDWLVGGTGRDNLYGGWGNDLLNVDDDLNTDVDNDGIAENDAPETHPFYEDRAYGGAGRDVLIANTGGDRLIDWSGEFNSYIVPFGPFGNPTVSRSVNPQLIEFLYDLSEADGADPTRASDTGTAADRNGEPAGELGLVTKDDEAWQDQKGAPDDPQPGNRGGGSRDVRVSAAADDGSQDLTVQTSDPVTASGGSLDDSSANTEEVAVISDELTSTSADEPSPSTAPSVAVDNPLPSSQPDASTAKSKEDRVSNASPSTLDASIDATLEPPRRRGRGRGRGPAWWLDRLSFRR